jgi:hypothetical protein
VIDDAGEGVEVDIEARYPGCSASYPTSSLVDGRFAINVPVRDTYTPSYIPLTFTAPSNADAPTTRLLHVGGLPLQTTKVISDTYVVTGGSKKGKIDVKLRNAADDGKVKVGHTTLVGADGEIVSGGLKKVDPGNYSLSMEAKGYFDMSMDALVRPGVTTSVNESAVTRSKEQDTIIFAAAKPLTVTFKANDAFTCQVGADEGFSPDCAGTAVEGN